MRFLVTAGPTREPLDDVRFLSNRSTGRMGFAVAEAAVSRGHETVLVSGPVSLPAPPGVDFVGVETALQMRDAVFSRLEKADVLVMAAAVADFRPAVKLEGKRKKAADGGETWTIDLVRNPDILAQAAETKGRRIHVGFAVESSDLEANAAGKLRSKKLDFVVANDLSAFGGADSTVHLIFPEDAPRTLANLPKRETALEIVRLCEALASRPD